MKTAKNQGAEMRRWVFPAGFLALAVIGGASFFAGIGGSHPERAWQAYHINFLLWSAIAQGGMLFSMIMHMTRAKWSGPLSNLSESFAAFFPLSFLLFLILFLGREYLFPWLHQDLHGKEVWLNIPFLFTRDLIGLAILYGLGFAYLYNALQLKAVGSGARGGALRGIVGRCSGKGETDAGQQRCKWRMTLFGGFYIFAFAVVLSLISYDLVMSMDPHWISTLFGAYSFVKAFYLGLGGLLILASIQYLSNREKTALTPAQFHDLGKLFFGFCLVWADFFYCQLVVIWYGNIPEETHYVIQRTLLAPWEYLAWIIFAVCFIVPFFILLNQKIKTKPAFMILLCSVIIIGLWFEHLLLLGPAWNANAQTIPVGINDGLITLGFFGLMASAIALYFNLFPELVPVRGGEMR